MRAGKSQRRAVRALAGVLLLLGCAGDLAAIDGGFRHRSHGYAFAAPPAPWERVSVKDAVIAYRRPGPATMSLQSRCGSPVAEPAVMARHLRIGVPDPTLRQAGPVAVGGYSGWTQTFDVGPEGGGVRVKTVTVVENGCAIDWVLVAASGFEEAEPDFDAWVAGVRLPGDPARLGAEQ